MHFCNYGDMKAIYHHKKLLRLLVRFKIVIKLCPIIICVLVSKGRTRKLQRQMLCKSRVVYYPYCLADFLLLLYANLVDLCKIWRVFSSYFFFNRIHYCMHLSLLQKTVNSNKKGLWPKQILEIFRNEARI